MDPPVYAEIKWGLTPIYKGRLPPDLDSPGTPPSDPTLKRIG